MATSLWSHFFGPRLSPAAGDGIQIQGPDSTAEPGIQLNGVLSCVSVNEHAAELLATTTTALC